MKGFLIFIWEILKIVIVALAIVLPIRTFLFQPFLVKGQSMEPNFHGGDYLIVDQLSYWLREPKRGEVIIFKYPKNPSQKYIKRIIGIPGDTIEIKDGKVFVSGNQLKESEYLESFVRTESSNFEIIHLDKNQYFVMGDNRIASYDSRMWGPLPRNYIIGKVFIKIQPFTTFAKVLVPEY